MRLIFFFFFLHIIPALLHIFSNSFQVHNMQIKYAIRKSSTENDDLNNEIIWLIEENMSVVGTTHTDNDKVYCQLNVSKNGKSLFT